MKTLVLYLCFFVHFVAVAQNTTTKSFMFQDLEMAYTRVDYSKYGITQCYITMYNTNVENNLIQTNAINCLKDKENLYHTLYFFLKIPTDIKKEKDKNELFSEFVAHLTMEENLEQCNLYVNMDKDYSISYAATKNHIKRLVTNISAEEICEILSLK